MKMHEPASESPVGRLEGKASEGQQLRPAKPVTGPLQPGAWSAQNLRKLPAAALTGRKIERGEAN